MSARWYLAVVASASVLTAQARADVTIPVGGSGSLASEIEKRECAHRSAALANDLQWVLAQSGRSLAAWDERDFARAGRGFMTGYFYSCMPAFLYNAGQAFLHSKQTELACAAFSRLVAQYPTAPTADETRTRILPDVCGKSRSARNE
jgi:hypothetical protein